MLFCKSVLFLLAEVNENIREFNNSFVNQFNAVKIN